MTLLKMVPKLKIVTFSCLKNAQNRVGILLDNKSVVDLSQISRTPAHEDMLKLIDGGKNLLDDVRIIAKSPPANAVIDEKTYTLKAPIPLPRRNVFCIGKNYIDHIAEVAKATTATVGTGGVPDGLPNFPIFFTKAPECVISTKDHIESHSNICKSLDYEAELAVIIGTGGRDIKAKDAMSHVFGYTIANDVTARDLQKKHLQWFKGKTLDRSCPMGPCIVVADDLDPSDLSIKLSLNGKTVQDSRTSKMIFNIPAIIESLSEGFTLNAGDIILTGTPEGVGFAMKPVPRTLLAGDVVSIDIEHIGNLENTVVA